MIRLTSLGLVTACALLAGCVTANPGSSKWTAYTQFLAASELTGCEGIRLATTPSPAELLMQQDHLTKAQLDSLYYYGPKAQAEADVDQLLRARGVSPDDARTKCALANSVAGTDDPIGRFLVKGSS